MTVDTVVTRHYLLTCRRCRHTWGTTYQVRSIHDDAGDHEVYYRGGAPAAAPAASRCPQCGGLRVAILPSRPE
jgi:hypothetical protein